MSYDREPMPWERIVSDGSARCSKCGSVIDAGGPAEVRHGERLQDALSRSAYPADPTTFCVPCVTPREMTPGEEIAFAWSRTPAVWSMILPDLLAWDDPLDDLGARIDAALAQRRATPSGQDSAATSELGAPSPTSPVAGAPEGQHEH